MSYDYQVERPKLFTEGGVEMLTKVRDNVRRLVGIAGAFRADKAWHDVTGDSWLMLACLDYLVEKKEIRELTHNVWGQDRVFVGAAP